MGIFAVAERFDRPGLQPDDGDHTTLHPPCVFFHQLRAAHDGFERVLFRQRARKAKRGHFAHGKSADRLRRARFFLTRVRIREIRQKHGGLRPERAVQIFLRAAKHLFDDARAHALRALEQIFDLGKVFHVGRHADDLGALARKQIG